jgi:hypothetical protein
MPKTGGLADQRLPERGLQKKAFQVIWSYLVQRAGSIGKE